MVPVTQCFEFVGSWFVWGLCSSFVYYINIISHYFRIFVIVLSSFVPWFMFPFGIVVSPTPSDFSVFQLCGCQPHVTFPSSNSLLSVCYIYFQRSQRSVYQYSTPPLGHLQRICLFLNIKAKCQNLMIIHRNIA